MAGLASHPRIVIIALVFIGALSLASPDPHAQQPVTLVPLTPPSPPIIVDGLEVLPVQGKVHVIIGAGGNVSAQVGDEGVLLVDSGAAGQSNTILTAISRLTTRRVRFLINTNDDADHIAGNGAIVKAHGGTRGPRPGGVGGGNPRGPNAGVMTMAHENAFNRMSTARPGLPALTGEALPESTFFTPKKEFFSNGEVIQLLAQPNAHTDGDVMVFFRSSDVLSTGDVFVTTSYPVIDTSRGGSVQGVIDALNMILDITVPERNQMGGTRHSWPRTDLQRG
jgi:glyoxylase-like metal-dependent hydrolase (beta-lactamase superfamily II)